MTRIAAGFHVRDDDWILPRKLDALRFCDRVVVLIDDRSPVAPTAKICQAYPNVITRVHKNTQDLPDLGPDGPICEEGRMRQETWDLLAESNPDWVILGDADEIPTPDVVEFLADPPDVDLVYLDVVQLYQSSRHYIGGPDCLWSHEHPGSNKKGALIHFDPAVHRDGGYRYDERMQRHCRLEPSPTHKARAVVNPRRIHVDQPKLIHWKWVNWDRWQGSFQAELPKYQRLWEGMTLKNTPEDWLWD